VGVERTRYAESPEMRFALATLCWHCEDAPLRAVDGRLRPVGSGIRAFLLVATPLAFLGGAQVTLLSEHTETYRAWTIAVPISAIFIGASFLATSVLFAWGLSQREWIRVRAVVSGGHSSPWDC
jgi:hypothetical protein